jgi:hypothetical protein
MSTFAPSAMGEIVALSLFMGSLGVQATFMGGWLRWQQMMRREREEEEEAMTPYDSQETLQSIANSQSTRSSKTPKDPRLVGWEFKIVRAQRDIFHDPLVFQRMCEEEANAGWILLEKLDDRRARFKRPIALREIIKADMMPVDPYRSHYGAASRFSPWLLGIVGLMVVVVPAYLAFVLVSMMLHKPAPAAPASPSPIPSLNPPSVPPQS